MQASPWLALSVQTVPQPSTPGKGAMATSLLGEIHTAGYGESLSRW